TSSLGECGMPSSDCGVRSQETPHSGSRVRNKVIGPTPSKWGSARVVLKTGLKLPATLRHSAFRIPHFALTCTPHSEFYTPPFGSVDQLRDDVFGQTRAYLYLASRIID